MTVASRQMLRNQVPTDAQIDQPSLRPVADDDLAIDPLERGACDDARLLLGALSIDPGGHALEPRAAVRIRQWNSRVHLGDIRFRMQRIAFLERPAEPRG